MSSRLSIAVDYSVIDHLQRVQAGFGGALHHDALLRVHGAAVVGDVQLWAAEITLVEMTLGIKNLDGRDDRRLVAAANDSAKRALMSAMRMRILAYPCGKCDDQYSLCDGSLRCAGEDWDDANGLEERLRRVPGIDEGDARQLVSCAFPADADAPPGEPKLDWFVAADRRMIASVKAEIAAQRLPELAHIRFGLVTDIAAGLEAAAA
jgi:hypothetical protein